MLPHVIPEPSVELLDLGDECPERFSSLCLPVLNSLVLVGVSKTELNEPFESQPILELVYKGDKPVECQSFQQQVMSLSSSRSVVTPSSFAI